MRLLAVLLFFSGSWSFALSGDWSSGGGEIFRTSENPWFLSNTKAISYCVVMDPVHFGNLPMSVDDQIQMAYRYWQENFLPAEISVALPVPFSLQMATQTLQRQAVCSSTTDIIFYFGVRPPKFETYIQDLTSFVGAAVRTDYDEVNLRGRGFVYISADGGKLSYKGQFLKPGAWHLGQGGLLFKLLVHELGHVFGMPHISENIIMNEHFPENLLLPMNSDMDLPWPTFEGVRTDGLADENCFNFMRDNVPFLDFFEIPKNLRSRFCYRMTFDPKTGTGAVYYGQTRRDPMTLAGSIVDTRMSVSPLGGVTIWLPKAQTVIQGLSPFMTVRGATAVRREVTGTFRSFVTGQEREIYLVLTPVNWVGGTKIGGIINGKLVFDLLNP